MLYSQGSAPCRAQCAALLRACKSHVRQLLSDSATVVTARVASRHVAAILLLLIEVFGVAEQRAVVKRVRGYDLWNAPPHIAQVIADVNAEAAGAAGMLGRADIGRTLREQLLTVLGAEYQQGSLRITATSPGDAPPPPPRGVPGPPRVADPALAVWQGAMVVQHLGSGGHTQTSPDT